MRNLFKEFLKTSKGKKTPEPVVSDVPVGSQTRSLVRSCFSSGSSSFSFKRQLRSRSSSCAIKR